MNHDYPDHWFARPDEYLGAYQDGQSAGWHMGAAEPLHSMTSPVAGWDPVEELTYLLQDAATADQVAAVPPPRSEPSPGIDSTDDPMDNLVQLTAELPPIRRFSAGHRKVRAREPRFTRLQTLSYLIAAIACVIVSMVSVFGGMVAYAPLLHVAGARGAMAEGWPLLIYGPWMVASLSILRAALHQRRAMHSWFVVLLFSSLAMILCMAEADMTFTSVASAALPAIASLACFQQMVRQITLTRPPRQRTSRRRQRLTLAPPESTNLKGHRPL
ncbi:DUF2637 domain-containing protein [Streptomyces sp. NPDC049915]|uniref:DUF2637 domain-containing protein n=1 Tax=Streptomyces sp. NPDC049915 TaxID=3155510 RepID=UPI003434AE2D